MPAACRLLLPIVVAGLVGACTAVDTIDTRYDTTNRSTERARDRSILLNIVRASRNAPLNFVAISRVSGTTQATANIAIPSFLLGPTGAPADAIGRAAVFDPRTVGGSASASGSYDLTVLESKDFYNALLSPVDLPTLSYFQRQGYSRELLFWLFTDSVRETAQGRTVEYRNEPHAADACEPQAGGERCFRDMVDVAMASGLTTQTRTMPDPANPKSHLVYGRLCFDPVLAVRARREYGPDLAPGYRTARYAPRCDSPWRLPKPTADTLTFDVAGASTGPVHYDIITRSTFGIYQFLGRILAQDATEEVVIRGPRGSSEDRRILALAPERSPCFTDVAYEGRMFCVPEQGAENTKRIFSLLVQLVALKTQSADLAITPAVRVTP